MEHVKDLRSREDFEASVLDSDKPSLIDFWAPWCGPCKATGPHFQAAAEVMGGEVNFCKVNTDEAKEIGSAFNIRSIPTLLVFHDGEVVDVHVGAATRPVIERMARAAAKRAEKARLKAERGGLVDRVKGLFGGGKKAEA